MGHLVAREAWAVIDLNTTEGRVWVQEDWQYTWTVMPGARPWTIEQKRHFHNTLDRQVWANWSDRVKIRVAGDHDLARRFGTHGMRLTFDIHWVTKPGHWSVSVRKMPPGSDPTSFISNVTFSTRKIELDSADLDSYEPQNAAGQSRRFFAGPHEFGHTMDNPDEYNADSPQLADTDSIMNIGNQLRPRHLHLIEDALHGLVPACTFTVA